MNILFYAAIYWQLLCIFFDAKKLHINWWITSALESNVGLNAIAQFTFQLQNKLPQGLGTGSLFSNNFDSPLEVKNGELHYKPTQSWNLKNLEN